MSTGLLCLYEELPKLLLCTRSRGGRFGCPTQSHRSLVQFIQETADATHSVLRVKILRVSLEHRRKNLFGLMKLCEVSQHSCGPPYV